MSKETNDISEWVFLGFFIGFFFWVVVVVRWLGGVRLQRSSFFILIFLSFFLLDLLDIEEIKRARGRDRESNKGEREGKNIKVIKYKASLDIYKAIQGLMCVIFMLYCVNCHTFCILDSLIQLPLED